MHLIVRPNGAKIWRLEYRFGEKEKTLSFGAYHKDGWRFEKPLGFKVASVILFSSAYIGERIA
ncbi:Arm DNA-binding domain-containing protein [Gluconobacter cerinus]|uniref:Arm DNA-binding domain-containing protein n=1 Tax=Gluconobacter cerinus TaxID=38307 RepID=UPI0038CFDA4B